MTTAKQQPKTASNKTVSKPRRENSST